MRRLRFPSLALAVAGLLQGMSALAQDTADPGEIERRIEQLRPAPAPAPQPVLPRPPAAPPLGTGAEVSFVLAAVTIEGATAFEVADLGPLYAEFLARTIGPVELEEIARRVTSKYNEAGYFLSRAIVPPQDIQGGVLRLKIIEGYIADLRFPGGWAQESLLDGYRAAFTRERPAQLSTVERTLLLINGLPGIRVGDVEVAELDEEGAFELLVSVTYSSVSGSANLDNRGTPAVGPVQGWASADFNSILGLGERIQLSLATVPTDTSELIYSQFDYRQPLGTAGTTAGASVARGNIEAGSDLADQDTESRSTTAKLDLRHPFLLSRRQAFNLQGAIELRNVSEDRFTVSTIDDRLRVLRLQADYALRDDLGGTSFLAFQVAQGLDILGASDAGDANLSRADGDGTFTKFKLDVVRVQEVWGPVSLRLAGQGQAALDPLLSSEEFLLGGSLFGRAYDFGEISGEHGLAGSAELRFGREREGDVLTRYEFYGFFDGGSLWNRKTGTLERRQSLTSTGAGARLNVTRNIQTSIEVAKPLNRTVETTGDRNLRVFFVLSAQF